ncbi:T3SS effector HopA1 family protein [Gynuella sunshinyii]|uniref:Uncharacterized protein n=1 Tax=Gynuella sunshinyii YC6258 TaxID=1445510 RepID=A0A0C5VTJ3_9GAMM|nr:T3SS effector HopA1 family protein [Gynuella sunshinyii]AJQ97506.1 hypothetical Protein YC6258_05478 [Gynuella sunshinyii YC6258]
MSDVKPVHEQLRGDKVTLSRDAFGADKSIARVGMRVWLEKAYDLHQSGAFASKDDKGISSSIKSIYNQHTVRVTDSGIQVSKAHPVKVSDESGIRQQAQRELGDSVAIDETRLPSKRGTAGFFAFRKDVDRERQQHAKETGIESRFSLISRKLRGADNPDQASQDGFGDRSYKRVWKGILTGASQLFSGQGKIMTAGNLARGRADAGVVYSQRLEDEQQITSAAGTLSEAIKGSRSYHVPFGMDRADKGVAFGETIRHVSVSGSIIPAPGYHAHDPNVSSSFGNSRAPIIKHALDSILSEGLSHEEALSRSIKHFGYDVQNPSRVSTEAMQQRQMAVQAMKRSKV